jgi:glycosyltransferase involved in cell wall biosynthesis
VVEDRLRIAFLSASGQPGGAETCLLDMVASLRAAFSDWPLLVVAPADGPLIGRARTLGAEAIVVPFPPAIARLGETAFVDIAGAARFATRVGLAAGPIARYTAALKEALERFDPDLVHTNGLKMHLFGAYAADAPVVWHVHDYLAPRRMARRLLRWNVGRCAAVIANSDSVATDVRAALGPAVTVTRMYNAVDLSRFSADGDRLDLDAISGLPPAPSETVRVGLVATFARWKGHEVFLRALAALPATLPLRGYIVGGPVYQTHGSQCSLQGLRTLADRMGLSSRVGFTGLVDRIQAAMRALDIVVHASTAREPFGLVIAEAMACGRAVVVSHAGGAAELVTPDVDALAHAPGDVPSLARAIHVLATAPDRRAALGRAARATAVRRFDRAGLAAELMAVYGSIASRRAGVAVS